ncbi:hypothetical protein V7112_23375 [Bacillus sp. JJ1566]|uniref:hypothetical protein n=1 Tax=Bacillus sp. JJ1566 TaxID=3122961 RepID=UPI002FFEA15F
MKYIKGLLVLLLLFLIVIGLFPRQASACSCAYPESVKDELNRKTAVFSGKVIDLVDENKFSYIQSSGDPIEVLFEVNESWKGINTSQVIISTARSGASCGYEFELNKEYLVYAYGEINQLETGFCERTALLSVASEDLALLGQGKEPTEKVDLQDELGKSNLVYLLSIIAILLVIGFIIWKRIKKPRL